MPSRLSRSLIYLLVFALLLPAQATQPINAENSFPGSVMPTAQRNNLARHVLGNLWLRDPEINQYFRYVNQTLAPDEDYFFTAANIDVINAFAYIGGLIVLYTGLWTSCNTEDEFISVIAHEMGHLKLEHFAKSEQNSKEASMVAIPLLIAGLLAAEDSETTEAVIASTSGFLASDFVAYSRTLEHEADLFALDLLTASHRDAASLVKVYQRFKSQGSEYISTHPAPTRRSAYINDRLRHTPKVTPPYRADFYLLKEKILFHQPNNLNYQQSRLRDLATATNSNRKTVLQYGLLLSATQKYDTKLGEAMIKELSANPHPYIQRAIGSYYLQQKQYDDALAVLLPAQRAHPNSIALLRELIRTYHLTQQHAHALQAYQNAPAIVRQNIDIATMAAQASRHLKQNALSNYILASAYAWDGRLQQARRQISVAEQEKSVPPDLLVKISELSTLIQQEMDWLAEQ